MGPWAERDVIGLRAWLAGRESVSSRDGTNGTTRDLALSDYRSERTAIARLERMEREGLLVRAEDVGRVMSRCAVRFRAVAQTLLRQFGNDAYSLMEEAIDDLEREFGLHDHSSSRPTTET